MERARAMRTALGWRAAASIAGPVLRSTDNPLRTEACSASYTLAADRIVLPPEGPGLGVEVDESYLRAHPLTDGAAWH
jgi:L-alanine-DL-glutamate epimerase-like enolase superfamily enzyme